MVDLSGGFLLGNLGPVWKTDRGGAYTGNHPDSLYDWVDSHSGGASVFSPQRLAGKTRPGSRAGPRRGRLTCLGNVAYYDVLNRGAKAATVIPLTALYPLVTVLLAVAFLKERLNRVQFLGILFSLSAIYLFNVPHGQGFTSPWLFAAMIPIMLWGIAGLFQKIATNHLSGELATLWFFAAFVPVAIFLLLRHPLPASMTARTWLLVIALGFTFGLGNFALLAAFSNQGKASVIAPLAGLYPLVSIPIALVAFHERIGWREGLGILLALVSVAALARETPAPEIKIEHLKPGTETPS